MKLDLTHMAAPNFQLTENLPILDPGLIKGWHMSCWRWWCEMMMSMMVGDDLGNGDCVWDGNGDRDHSCGQTHENQIMYHQEHSQHDHEENTQTCLPHGCLKIWIGESKTYFGWQAMRRQAIWQAIFSRYAPKIKVPSKDGLWEWKNAHGTVTESKYAPGLGFKNRVQMHENRPQNT